MEKILKQYLDALEFVLENGKEKTDRTGTGTISYFGYQMRFDLRNEFPAVTTKKLAWKAVVSELLWFLEGSTDERRLAEILYEKPREELIGKTTIWTANADKQGRDLGYTNNKNIKLLGPIYGNMWKKTASLDSSIIIEIEKKVFPDLQDNIKIEKATYTKNDEFVGKTIKNKYSTEYKVLEKINTPKNSSYIIQCIKTGHKETVTRPNLKNSSFGQKILFDRFYSTVKKDKSIKYYSKAYNLWYNMISRCYNKDHPNYKNYGAKGIIVNSRWNDFKMFLYDIESLPFFYEWANGTENSINNWCLDKDYYNTNMYSKETCLFLPSKINKAYSNHEIDFSEKIIVELEDGTKHEFIFINDIINKFPDKKFSKESIRLCLTNAQQTHKSCKFTKIKAKNNHVFRKKIVFDQIAQVLESLHYDPDSRRHIVSAWNADRIGVMALPPCHTLFQFYVQNEELSCQLYQRSVDLFLGAPFNIASYSLLVHMFAQLLDLKVGDFIWTGGDCHIYLNHLDQVREQISRQPKPGPRLEMPEFRTLDELIKTRTSDYKLIVYDPMPSIKAPMAV
jgi:thymidylate synthase